MNVYTWRIQHRFATDEIETRSFPYCGSYFFLPDTHVALASLVLPALPGYKDCVSTKLLGLSNFFQTSSQEVQEPDTIGPEALL